MYLVEAFDKQITASLKAKNDEEQAKRVPSGKLSASGLGEPTQWQILKTLGIGSRVIDDYLYRKFARGKDVEEWYLDAIKDKVQERQKFLSYREAIGYCDAMVDVSQIGVAASLEGLPPFIPMEVKSVSNAKFKRILERGEADPMHKLQGGFYGLGANTSYYALTYIAADDYRTLTWVFKTADEQREIDSIIDEYQAALAAQIVPVFKERYKWQASAEYNKFPDWQTLNAREIDIAIKAFAPDAWANLKKGV